MNVGEHDLLDDARGGCDVEGYAADSSGCDLFTMNYFERLRPREVNRRELCLVVADVVGRTRVNPKPTVRVVGSCEAAMASRCTVKVVLEGDVVAGVDGDERGDEPEEHREHRHDGDEAACPC